MFPILNARGAVIGFGGRVLGEGEPKYLNSPETPLFEKGREVYGLVQARDAIRAAGRVLVVEGYMDVVALAQFGVGYAVATLGTATTPVHVSKLLQPRRRAGVLLRRRRRRAQGRLARARKSACRSPRQPADPLPVPAATARIRTPTRGKFGRKPTLSGLCGRCPSSCRNSCSRQGYALDWTNGSHCRGPIPDSLPRPGPTFRGITEPLDSQAAAG